MKKTCTGCKKEKDLGKSFSKDSSHKDGYKSRCNDCRSDYGKKHYLENWQRERNRLSSYAKENRDKINASSADYYEKNCEKVKETHRNYYTNNKEKYSTYNAVRRARKANIPGSHTHQQWEELKKAHNYSCVICGKTEPEIKLTRDHIIPISRPDLTPTHNIENIQPLCVSCNSRKKDKV